MTTLHWIMLCNKLDSYRTTASNEREEKRENDDETDDNDRQQINTYQK